MTKPRLTSQQLLYDTSSPESVPGSTGTGGTGVQEGWEMAVGKVLAI